MPKSKKYVPTLLSLNGTSTFQKFKDSVDQDKVDDEEKPKVENASNKSLHFLSRFPFF